MSLDSNFLDYFLDYQNHNLQHGSFQRALNKFPALMERIKLDDYWQGILDCYEQYDQWRKIHLKASNALQSHYRLEDEELTYEDAYHRLKAKNTSELSKDESDCLRSCNEALEAELELQKAIQKLKSQQQALFTHYQQLWRQVEALIETQLGQIRNSSLKDSVSQLMAIYQSRYDLDSYQRALTVLHVLEVYNQAKQSFYESLETDFELLESLSEVHQAHFGMDLNYRNLRRVHHLANTLQYGLAFIEVMCLIAMFAALTVMAISLSTLISLPLLVPALAFATGVVAAGIFIACYLTKNLIERHKPYTYNPKDYPREQSSWFNKEGKVVEFCHLGDKEKARRQKLSRHRLFNYLSTFQSCEPGLVARFKDEVQALSETFSNSNRIL